MSTTNPMTAELHNAIQRHVRLFGASHTYANERTLRRFLAPFLAHLDADGLAAHLQIVTIEAGPKAGRLCAVLGFEIVEQVTPEACAYAFHGILLIQAKA